MPTPAKPGATDRTVRYGGWLFSVPSPFATAFAPNCAGMYAVQVVNASWTPCPFEPIFFGQSMDLSEHVIAGDASGVRALDRASAGRDRVVRLVRGAAVHEREGAAQHRRRPGDDLPDGGRTSGGCWGCAG